MVTLEGLVKAGEAQILANRQNMEKPPQRHRGRRDGPDFTDNRGFDLIFCGLCVSVVRKSQEGHAQMMANYAKQNQFPDGQNQG